MAEEVSKFVPIVPKRLPLKGDTVLYVLRPLGKGKECFPQTRPAMVTEDWKGRDKHPTGQARGPDGKVIVGQDGKPFLPAGIVNLDVHLDAFARKDLNEGHNKYEGNVLYDPAKSHGTWHWPGE